MASFFKRLFSSSFRKAKAAEAEGQLEEAASLYAQAGEPGAVSRIHRLRARSQRDAWKRIEILRLAHEYAERDDVEAEERSTSRLELAEALVAWVDAAGLTDRQDKSMLEEAAGLFEKAGQHEQAGDVYARIGFFNSATESYTEAGAVEKLEQVIDREENELAPERKERSLLDEFRFAEAHGRFLEALTALDQAIEANPGDPSLRDLHHRFTQRIPKRSRIHIKVEGSEGSVVFLGADTLTIGRDESADMPLLAPGISRLHVQLVRQDEGWIAEDLDSKNGTRVNGTSALPTAPLGDAGEIELGDRCRLEYEIVGGCVALRPAVARARNTLFIWGAEWTSGMPASPLPTGVCFRCVDGYWHIRAPMGTVFDGEPFAGEVLLRRDTVLEMGLDATAVILRVEA